MKRELESRHCEAESHHVGGASCPADPGAGRPGYALPRNDGAKGVAHFEQKAQSMRGDKKISKLKDVIASYESVLVAFSGGADSTLVLKIAREVLGRDRVKAATSVTESFTGNELEESRKLARLIDVEQVIVEYSELAIPGYAENSPRRCYFCKDALYEHLQPLREKLGLNILANGTNLDDLTDYRPGNEAAKECHVRSPLVEAGLTKVEVREISKFYELPTWDTPANACLSSRVPFGEPVTAEKLEQIERSEAFLKSLGFRHVRVRHHGSVARIEVGGPEIAQFFDESIRKKVDAELRRLGFLYVTLDLAGYRSGAMNQSLIDRHYEAESHHVGGASCPADPGAGRPGYALSRNDGD